MVSIYFASQEGLSSYGPAILFTAQIVIIRILKCIVRTLLSTVVAAPFSRRNIVMGTNPLQAAQCRRRPALLSITHSVRHFL